MKKISWIGAILVVIIIGTILTNSKTKVSTGEIKIGVISTLTGNAAYYGESTMKGAEIGRLKALEEHPDVSISLYHEDSLFTPKGGIDAYNKLVSQNGINALITQASNISAAIQPLAAADSVLHAGVSTLANNFSTPDDLSFRLTAKGNIEAEPALNFLAEKGAQKLGIIYINNEIGVSLHDSLVSIAPSYGIEILAAEAFAPNATDFRTLLIKMKDRGVDSIYLAALASQTSIMLVEAENLKLSVPFISYRAAEDPLLITRAGTQAEKLYYTNAYDLNTESPENLEFARLYKEKYGQVPNGYAAEAYEAVRLIADIKIACGEDTECAKDFLQKVKDRPSVFGKFSLDAYGDVTYNFFIKTVRDSKFVRFTK